MEIINGKYTIDNGLTVIGGMTGSLSGSLSGSLFGTASFATLALNVVNAPQPAAAKLFNYYNFI
jgi:hypothetical protein